MNHRGFTIVELLIVIIVIAILAAITTVAYKGLQGRAYDTTVQTDIKTVARKFELFRADNGYYPVSTAQVTSLAIRVSKSAYGNGYLNNIYNFAVCRLGPNPVEYSIVVGTKSGTIFVYKSTTATLTTISSWPSNDIYAICQSTGINSTAIGDYDVFYAANAWKSYIGG